MNISDPTKYYITDTDKYIKCLVTELSRLPLSIPLKTAVVGTMHHDRKGILKKMKSLQQREEMSTLYANNDKKDIIMLSYTNKKKSGEKNRCFYHRA